MKKATQAVSKLTPFLIATLVLTALPAAAKAAEKTPSDAAALLAKGAGYGSPNGSPRVAQLQKRLRVVGENPGPIDGLFGPLTEAAVVRYQRRDGLAADGLVGPETRAALRRAVKTVGRGAGYGMRHGSARVRKLQTELRLAGARPGPVDGRFGPRTEAAVIRFQRNHGLAADRLAGEATRRVLAQQFERETAAEPTRTKAPRGVPEIAKRLNTGTHIERTPERSVSLGTIILAVFAVLLAAAGALGIPEILARRMERSEAPRRPEPHVETPDEAEEEAEEVTGTRRARRSTVS